MSAVTETQITAENVLRLFPEVNTTLIGAARDTAAQDADLAGYDEEQIRLMDEMCIVLDENDVPIGSASKKICSSHLSPIALCGERGSTVVLGAIAPR